VICRRGLHCGSIRKLISKKQGRLSFSDVTSHGIHASLAMRDRNTLNTLVKAGGGVHPDHKAVTDIVTYGVFYARLPKWNEISGGEIMKHATPHEIDRLFFGHCGAP
jgi:hypothetical protein